jgi:hypothetical protein
VLAFDGLDPGLLIDRQHDRALGRLAIQRADRVDLLPELRVRAVQPLPNTVWAHVARLQDALQVAAADLLDHPALHSAIDQFIQRRCGPPLYFGRLTRQRQQFQPLRRADAPGPTRPYRLLQALESLPGQARAPVRHGLHRNAHRLRDRRRRLAGVAHQRDMRSNHLSVLSGASAGQQLKRLAILSRQSDRLCLSSSTHAPKLTSTPILMKATYRMLY